jgi:hypothetical protein
MKTQNVLALVVAVLGLGSAASAQFLPGSAPGAVFTIDLYEPPEGTGEFSSTPLPTGVTPGFLVLTERPTFSNDPKNWSDVVEFGRVDAQGLPVALFYSDVEGQPFNSTLISQVLSTPGTVYLPEKTDPTLYYAGPVPGGATYWVHSDVPEPAALGLLGLGTVVLWRRRNRRSVV